MANVREIGMAGVGLLGSAIAERLIGGGFRVIGYDVSEQCRRNLEALGGRAAASLREVAACPRILLSLPMSSIALSVVNELIPHLRPGSLIVDTTTGDPQEMIAIADTLASRGHRYVDATVGGSSQHARERDVIVLCGGEAADVEDARELLDAFAREVFHVGPRGSGARMKLVLNLVLGLNRAVLAEGLAFAKGLGVDASAALAILRAGPAYSRAMDVKGPRMLSRDFEPQARLSQHLKDVRLILESGERSGIDLPLSTVHRELLERVEAAGYGSEDNSAVIRAYE